MAWLIIKTKWLKIYIIILSKYKKRNFFLFTLNLSKILTQLQLLLLLRKIQLFLLQHSYDLNLIHQCLCLKQSKNKFIYKNIYKYAELKIFITWKTKKLKTVNLRLLTAIRSAFCLFQSSKRLLRYSSNSFINLRRLSITSCLNYNKKYEYIILFVLMILSILLWKLWSFSFYLLSQTEKYIFSSFSLCLFVV